MYVSTSRTTRLELAKYFYANHGAPFSLFIIDGLFSAKHFSLGVFQFSWQMFLAKKWCRWLRWSSSTGCAWRRIESSQDSPVGLLRPLLQSLGTQRGAPTRLFAYSQGNFQTWCNGSSMRIALASIFLHASNKMSREISRSTGRSIDWLIHWLINEDAGFFSNVREYDLSMSRVSH